MLQLTLDEAQPCAASRFQFGTIEARTELKYLPRVFTQEGGSHAFEWSVTRPVAAAVFGRPPVSRSAASFPLLHLPNELTAFSP